jgi:DnaJ-class molecular chaperone
MALKFHPMKNSEQMRMYEPKFQLICEAYEVLSSNQLKTIYEQYGNDVLRQGIKGPDGSK